jgi:hypothetical protein
MLPGSSFSELDSGISSTVGRNSTSQFLTPRLYETVELDPDGSSTTASYPSNNFVRKNGTPTNERWWALLA